MERTERGEPMSSDESVYRAPESSLARSSTGDRRSLDDAIAGRYDFQLGEVLSEAWDLTNGSKGVILGAIAISLGVNIATQAVTLLGEADDSGLLLLLGLVISLAANAVIYTINGGVFLYAIKRAAGDETASFDDVLSCFNLIVPIFGLMLLSGLLTVLGFFLLVLPGIYLAVAYLLALPLKVERGLAIWDCLETSRKAITRQWLKVAVTAFVTGLAVALGSVLTLGIGAIWLLPFGALVFGILYREIFGYDPSA
jgi:hypothetical protein